MNKSKPKEFDMNDNIRIIHTSVNNALKKGEISNDSIKIIIHSAKNYIHQWSQLYQVKDN